MSKRTIFAVGVYRSVNSCFLEKLAEHFRVVVMKSQYKIDDPNCEISYAEELLPEDSQQVDIKTFTLEMHKLALHTNQQIQACLPGGANELSDKEFKKLFDIAFPIYSLSHFFQRFVEKIGVDLVLTNADCCPVRRTLIIQAKRLGIPTLNIEHGFNYSLLPDPEVFKHPVLPHPVFVADHVNLDNNIEIERWKSYFNFIGDDIATPRFTALGTPNNVSSDARISKRQARLSMSLAPDKYTVVIAGSWNEARDASMALTAMTNEISFYKNSFKVLRELQKESDLQVIVKLHPAYSNTQVYFGVEAFLKKVAMELDLNLVKICNDQLSETLAAADLLISPSDSSVIWEAFTISVPSIIYPMSSLFCDFFNFDQLNASNVLARNGWVAYVSSAEALKNAVSRYRDPETQTNLNKTAAVIRQKYKLENQSLDAKIKKLIHLINRLLEKPTDQVSSTQLNEIASLYAEGKRLVYEQKWVDGLLKLSKALDIQPNHAPTLSLIITVYEKLGHPEKAKDFHLLLANSLDAAEETNQQPNIVSIQTNPNGILLQIECARCEYEFSNAQTTLAGLPFSSHSCPRCGHKMFVEPAFFSKTVKKLLRIKQTEDFEKVRYDATLVAEQWRKNSALSSLLLYKGVDLGSSMEAVLAPHILHKIGSAKT